MTDFESRGKSGSGLEDKKDRLRMIGAESACHAKNRRSLAGL